MKIYFIRHGESIGNETETHQNKDTDLSDIGKFQARYVAKRFEKIHVDIILCSPYKRACQTAEAIKSVVKKDIIIDEYLREKKGPSEFIGKRYSDPSLIKAKKAIRRNALNPHWHYSDEENAQDTLDRARVFIKRLERRKEKDILAVTHGVFLRAVVVAMMDVGKDTNNIFQHVAHFIELNNTGITLCENVEGRWKLITLNDVAHLG